MRRRRGVFSEFCSEFDCGYGGSVQNAGLVSPVLLEDCNVEQRWHVVIGGVVGAPANTT